MKVNGGTYVVLAYQKTMRLSKIGNLALDQLPNENLKVDLVLKKTTLYDGTNNIMRIGNLDIKLKTKQELCATLCHETFHFFHAKENFNAYKMRRTTPTGIYEWQDYEEELTITGKVNGEKCADGTLDYGYYNENAVRKELGLPIRVSYTTYKGSEKNVQQKKNIPQKKKYGVMSFDFKSK